MIPALLYGVPAGCSFGSIVALEWLGQPYQLCRITMPQDTRDPGFVTLNPAGETPVLILEDGRALSESAAILGHIAWRGLANGSGPAPGSAAHDQLQQRLAFLNTTFFSAFSPYWSAYEGGMDTAAQAVLRTLGQQLVCKAYAILEQLLDGNQWLSGPGPGIADAYFAGLARWTHYHAVLDEQDYPAIHALHQRLLTDPAVRFAQAIEAGAEAVSSGGFQGHVELQTLVDSRSL